MPAGINSLKTRKTLKVGTRSYDYFSLKAAEKTLGDLSTLPNSMKVLLENLLRHEDGRTVTVDDVKAIGQWLKTRKSTREIAYRPARVLMQDFTGVPAVVDLAAMREAMVKLGGDATKINPLSPVDLVIVEGFKSEPHRKIEVHRLANGKAMLFPDDPGVVGIASDAAVETSLPVAHLDDIPAIAAMMQRSAISIEDVLAHSSIEG